MKLTIATSIVAGVFGQVADLGGAANMLRGGFNIPRTTVMDIYASIKNAEEGVDDMDKQWVTAIAQRSRVEEVPDHLYYAAFNYIVGAGDRGLNCEGGTPCTVPLSLRQLFGYGCWCNLGTDLGIGFGPPQDGYDFFCKNLQLCVRCAIRDTEDAGEPTCDPDTHEYKVSFTFGDDGLVGNCEDENPDDTCGQALCMCEVDWLNGIMNEGFAGRGLRVDEFSHNSTLSDFDVGATCGIHSRLGDFDHQCCGEYPSRYQYNGNSAECCDNVISDIGTC